MTTPDDPTNLQVRAEAILQDGAPTGALQLQVGAGPVVFALNLDAAGAEQFIAAITLSVRSAASAAMAGRRVSGLIVPSLSEELLGLPNNGMPLR